MRWARLIAHMGEMRSAYKIVVRIFEGYRPLWGWEIIRLDLREIGWEILGCIHLAQNRGSGGIF
jgi:hypothetical protein